MRTWRDLTAEERLAALKSYNDDLMSLSEVALKFSLGGRTGIADQSNLHKCILREARKAGVVLRTKGQGTSARDAAKQRKVAEIRFAADDPKRRAALQMIAEGKGRADVARTLGVHGATIRRWVKGLTNADSTSTDRERLRPQIRSGRPPTRYTVDRVAQFFRLHHEEGMTMLDVAHTTDASVDTVFLALYGAGRFSELSRAFIEQYGEPRIGTNLSQADVTSIFESYWLRNEPAEIIARRFGTNAGSILNLLNSKIERYAHWSSPLLLRYDLPCRHGKFDSRHEKYILTTLRADYPEVEIVGDRDRTKQPKWLGRQRLDIWIPDLLFAIEYNGIQHYEPVSAFGGDEKFAERQRDDALKLKKCADNCVVVLVIRYDEPLDRDYLYTVIERFLVDNGRVPLFSDWQSRGGP